MQLKHYKKDIDKPKDQKNREVIDCKHQSLNSLPRTSIWHEIHKGNLKTVPVPDHIFPLYFWHKMVKSQALRHSYSFQIRGGKKQKLDQCLL